MVDTTAGPDTYNRLVIANGYRNDIDATSPFGWSAVLTGVAFGAAKGLVAGGHSLGPVPGSVVLELGATGDGGLGALVAVRWGVQGAGRS